jgi:hypothetical protein
LKFHNPLFLLFFVISFPPLVGIIINRKSISTESQHWHSATIEIWGEDGVHRKLEGEFVMVQVGSKPAKFDPLEDSKPSILTPL